METTKRHALIAGMLYAFLVLIAPVRLVYIQNELFACGSAAEAVGRVLSNPGLLRIGILTDLFSATLEVFLTLALYQLFRPVDQRSAVLMAVLGLTPVPLYFFNVFNDAAIAHLVLGSGSNPGSDSVKVASLVGLATNLHDFGIHVLQIFWGAWLFPLAALAYRSRLAPRVVAIWLAVNGFAYLALSLTGLAAPSFSDTVSIFAVPAQLGEVAFTGCLLWSGLRRGTAAHTLAPA